MASPSSIKLTPPAPSPPRCTPQVHEEPVTHCPNAPHPAAPPCSRTGAAASSACSFVPSPPRSSLRPPVTSQRSRSWKLRSRLRFHRQLKGNRRGARTPSLRRAAEAAANKTTRRAPPLEWQRKAPIPARHRPRPFAPQLLPWHPAPQALSEGRGPQPPWRTPPPPPPGTPTPPPGPARPQPEAPGQGRPRGSAGACPPLTLHRPGPALLQGPGTGSGWHRAALGGATERVRCVPGKGSAGAGGSGAAQRFRSGPVPVPHGRAPPPPRGLGFGQVNAAWAFGALRAVTAQAEGTEGLELIPAAPAPRSAQDGDNGWDLRGERRSQGGAL
ncbi:transcription initiation factor TFIID subunit 4-like [Lathamus discolor]|uniref:transcription initiation factor TFIID subunit 4-like n=1 Tax=Lathamus discolor TaxID=678569 RepID=UPI0032B7EA08